jgi:murein DD-endopeptidase MepM/ murein hydrolase activator NlpD
MRAKMAAFALGFAAGVLCLSVGLWWTGTLNTTLRTEAATGNGAIGNVAAADVKLPPPIAGPNQVAPPPGVPLPPPVRESPPTSGVRPGSPNTKGEAERETLGVADTLHLAIPIAGVAAKDMTDSFNQARAGHKHEALDIPAPRGTPVMAAGQGNIVKLFTSKQGGLTVYQFDDSRTYCYYYAHLDRYAPGLREGVLLRRGDVLGYVGSTGDASPEAPHLHFALFKLGPEKKWWEGTAIDPLPFLR